MNNAHHIYTRITDRTRQRVYALSTPLQLADFTEATELMVSSTLDPENPSTHVLAITSNGVNWQPLVIADSLSYAEAQDAEIDAFLLETLAISRRESQFYASRPSPDAVRKPHRRRSFSLTRILSAAFFA
jgi:hypothetical protein